MDSMALVTKAVQALGASDTALTFMGPTLTIALALIGGIAVGQAVKWPLSLFLSDPLHGYIVRWCSVFATFCCAHYLSNHLPVPVEVVVALSQPLIYVLLKGAATKWAPWASGIFASVGPK